ncbi:hypothetical protein ACYSNU_18895 [Enterococcus sp. LJL120]
MNKGYIALWVLGLILLIIDFSIVVSLFKKGDERRQLIVWKSSTYAFSVTILILILDCVTALLSTGLNLATDKFDNNSSPFSLLTIISIVYFISLKYNQKKLGS